MSALAGLLLLAQAAAPPAVTARLDRTEVVEGEIVTLTITVTSTGNEAVQLVDPILAGFEMAGFREQTSVRVVNGVARRELVRALQLVARTPGIATIGSVRARQGEQVAETTPLTVEVRAASAAAPTLAPRVRAIVEAAEPPDGEDVVVRVLALPESLPLGTQVDLVTLAWFPRDVRSRLRTPPTLAPPSASGAWVYERATPSGIVGSRQANGRWWDLFVNHQVVFPLVPGPFTVLPATVRYRVPLTYSFLSRELEHVVESDTLRLPVRPFPDAGRPAGFTGAAGRNLTIRIAAEDTLLDGSTRVEMDVKGEGNVALWPEPVVAWPDGLRVYPGDVQTTVTAAEGRIGGTKRFTWLVVADSGGTLTVPPVRYPWFDLASGAYRTAATTALGLVATPRAAPVVTAAQGARPLLPARPALADRLGALPPWLLWAVLLVPPLLAGLAVLSRRWMIRPTVTVPAGALDHLEHRFRRRLSELVPASAASEARRLELALRAAGIEAALAQHAARVSERLRAAVFGRDGAHDADELGAEVEAVLAALAEQAGRHTRGYAVVTLLLVLLLPAGVSGQRAEQLMDAGAARAAADSFLARAAAAPGLAAHWYNAGVALEAAGAPERAWVAWRRAARLAPRHDAIAAAFGSAPADPLTARLAPVYPVRAEELLFLAGLLWAGGWLLLGLRRRVAGALVVGVGLVVAVGGWGVTRAYARPLAFALAADVPLREAPYGTAAAPRSLEAGAAAEVVQVRGHWLLVRRGAAEGWVLVGEVARL